MEKHQKKIIADALLRLVGDEILTIQERWELLAHIVNVLTGENIHDILTVYKNARRLRIKRGTGADNSTYVGMPGEITIDTDTNTLHIHDGQTPGGIAMAHADDIPFVPASIDQIVACQSPTAENNYTWYRKYASGWVEQGGSNWGTTQPTNVTITYPIPMASAVNHLNVTVLKRSADSGSWDTTGVKSQSATGFVSLGFTANQSADNSFVWEVKGMSATTGE